MGKKSHNSSTKVPTRPKSQRQAVNTRYQSTTGPFQFSTCLEIYVSDDAMEWLRMAPFYAVRQSLLENPNGHLRCNTSLRKYGSAFYEEIVQDLEGLVEDFGELAEMAEDTPPPTPSDSSSSSFSSTSSKGKAAEPKATEIKTKAKTPQHIEEDLCYSEDEDIGMGCFSMRKGMPSLGRAQWATVGRGRPTKWVKTRDDWHKRY